MRHRPRVAVRARHLRAPVVHCFKRRPFPLTSVWALEAKCRLQAPKQIHAYAEGKALGGWIPIYFPFGTDVLDSACMHLEPD